MPFSCPPLLQLPLLLSFFVSILLLFYQQIQISRLSNCHRPEIVGARVKRALEEPIEYSVVGPPEFEEKNANLPVGESRTEPADLESSISFPLYAKFQAKDLHKFCLRKFPVECGKGKGRGKGRNTAEEVQQNGTKQKLGAKGKGRRRRKKVCGPIHSAGPARLIGKRIHRSGAALRRGQRWFLTEYSSGYSLFQFDLARDGQGPAQQLAFPSRIHTLPEPFRGTDHTVAGSEGDETFFYEMASGRGMIQALHLPTGRRLTKLVYAAKGPLYGSAKSDADLDGNGLAASSFSSSMDLETDQLGALWLLFRGPNLSSLLLPSLPRLSVVKLAPESLKELGQWELEGVDPGRLANAFVSCGILYKVELEEGQSGGGSASMPRLSAAFDFQSGQYLPSSNPIETQGWNVSGPGSLSNVQYDPESDSLAVFDGGQVLSVQLQRGVDAED